MGFTLPLQAQSKPRACYTQGLSEAGEPDGSFEARLQGVLQAEQAIALLQILTPARDPDDVNDCPPTLHITGCGNVSRTGDGTWVIWHEDEGSTECNFEQALVFVMLSYGRNSAAPS